MVIRNFIKKLARTILVDQENESNESHLEYWQRRSDEHGEKAVIDIRHKDIAAITSLQQKEIYPILQELVREEDKQILDFGCGTGRFTADLAKIVEGEAIGIDPTPKLIELSKAGENVKFQVLEGNTLPFSKDCFDIVFICLVLGGIEDAEMVRWLQEIDRVLRAGGLLFLVENTSDLKSGKYWKYRPFTFYRDEVQFVDLQKYGSYIDFSETITIMAGRKK